MFHQHEKKAQTPSRKSTKELTRIVSASAMLEDSKRTLLLQKIETLCALEPKEFDHHVLFLLKNLLHHCQHLPETSLSYYTELGGFIDYALQRTQVALEIFNQYVLVEEGQRFSEEQKLWQYALLSASLLCGIGKLQLEYLVELYDKNSQFIKIWNPVVESMVTEGAYYCYSLEKEPEPETRKRLTILLASSLMPEGGFRWIASSSAVLRVWLALLEEDTRSARTLGAILTRAKSLAILQHFIQLAPSCNPASFPTSPERSTTFTEPPAMTQAELEKNLAIDFLAWVQASLAAGNLIINKHPLFTIAGGLLLGPALFDLYVLKNPFGVKNGKAVQHALLGLQLHQIEANNNILSRTKQKAGIVLREFAMVLPDRFQIESKGTISTFRATDFVYHAAFSQKEPCTLENLPHIHANGEWVHPTSSGVKTSIFFAAHSHG